MTRAEHLANVLVLEPTGTLAAQLAPALHQRFRVLNASQPDQAVAMAQDGRVHVLVLTGGDRATLAALRRMRELSPSTLCVVLAGKEALRELLPAAGEGDLFRVAQDLEELQGFIALAADHSRAFYAAGDPAPPADQQPCVLVLDEDTATAERVREALRLEPGAPRSIYWCDTLYEAFDALARRPVGLLVSDVRLDGEDISGGLRTLRGCHPEVVTVIHSAVKDTSGFSDLIGAGCMLVPKPASRERLAGALAAAMNPLAAMAFGATLTDLPARKQGGRIRALAERLGWPREPAHGI